ncbi:MAG TPA: tetratricopeptide repeat protein [Ktedonobacteraceae bacterium]
MALSYFSEPIKIFFSLASVDPDRKLFQQLCTHLSGQRQQGLIEIHHDNDISGGSDYSNIIHSYIREADIIVLLLSADFFNSDECVKREMPWAFEEHDTRAARVIPVLLRPTEWSGFGLERYSPLPPNGEPLSIWRDYDTACMEVARGIRKVIDEIKERLTGTHLPARTSPLPVLYILSHRPNPFFTDRKETLGELRRAFLSSRKAHPHIQVLYGLGGIGKTLLASAYAYMYHKKYEAIIWLNALRPELLSSSLPGLTAQLGIPLPRDIDENQYFVLLQHWLQRHDRWLLVIDNLEDFSVLDRFVPFYGSGHVLITTSTRPTRPFASALEVPPLSIEDGALLLLRRAHIIAQQGSSKRVPEDQRVHALAIAREVAGYPLALDQAGAYIEETERTLASYLELYRGQQATLLRRRGSVLPHEHPDSATTTLALTFQKVEQTNPTARALLHLCAFVHPDAFPNEVFTYGASVLQEPLRGLSNPFVLDEALGTLRRFALIQRCVDTTTLNMPSIVQLVLREELTESERREWASQVVRLLHAVFPPVRFETWKTCERYISQAQHCASLLRDFQLSLKEGGLLLERLGFYSYQRGFYTQAETYLNQALHFQEEHHKRDVIDIARTLNSLGLLAQRRAFSQNAEAFYQRALILRQRALGPYHPETAESLHNLAAWYEEHGQLDQAAQFYTQALAADERHGQTDPLDMAQTWNNLGLVYDRQGQLDQAGSAYQHALTIYERTSPPPHPHLSYTLTGLGALAEQRLDYPRAAQLYQQALEIRRLAFGENHSETAHSFNRLARILRLQGEYQPAEALYRKALAIGEDALGPHHPDVALFLNNLGLLALQQRDYQQAETFFERVLNILEQVHEPDPRIIASTLSHLEQLVDHFGKDTRAEALLQRARALRKQDPDATTSSD